METGPMMLMPTGLLVFPCPEFFTINPAGELRHELTQNFQTSYEAQSMQVENYFPSLDSLFQVELQMMSKSKKQSLYFGDRSDTTDHLSDTEDQVSFRLRSGTDISDSVNASRYKLQQKKKQFTKHENYLTDIAIHESGDAISENEPSTPSLDTHEDFLLDDLAEALPIELLLP